MTEIQIEAAAREYCRLSGQDPDARLVGSDPVHPTLARYTPAWVLVAGLIRDRLALDKAIEYGRSQPETGPENA